MEAHGSLHGVAQLAQVLGVSDRHLRRLFEEHWGVSPLQYLQTRRLLDAKTLLTDTRLPMHDVALAAGFGSLRHFNAVFSASFRMPPTRLRKQGDGGLSADACCVLKLGYRPPFDALGLLTYLQTRQISGMEFVATNPLNTLAMRTFSIEKGTTDGADLAYGWLSMAWPTDASVVVLKVSHGLHSVLPQVVNRVRAMLDLDADPQAIDAVLGNDFAGQAGLRVPGALDGFEVAVRAILGQQVTVAAGRTFVQRVVDRYGQPIVTPHAQLNRLFPTPKQLAQALPDELGSLGIVKMRQQALLALARAVSQGELNLNCPVDPAATMTQLQDLPGIGAWTANYIAMRALRMPDAWPAGDVALQRALGLDAATRAKPGVARRQCEQLSLPWRPWRSYAAMRIWAGLPAIHSERSA